MLMWFSGAKLPFLLWFFVFLIAFCLILAVKLDEHGVQLIGMKLYSALWNWIDLDPNKRVNVTIPSGDVLRTVMPAVPYIPEVIRAWTVAMRGLLGAILLSAFITIPLLICFLGFSSPRTSAILQDRLENGDKLLQH